MGPLGPRVGGLLDGPEQRVLHFFQLDCPGRRLVPRFSPPTHSDHAHRIVKTAGVAGHWLNTTKQWVSAVSAMSKSGSAHSATALFDQNDETFWKIGAFHNQWVMLDSQQPITLSRIELMKLKNGGFMGASWVTSKE